MDVIIISTDTDEVDAREIAAALDAAGYYVASVQVRDRHGNVAEEIDDPNGDGGE